MEAVHDPNLRPQRFPLQLANAGETDPRRAIESQRILANPKIVAEALEAERSSKTSRNPQQINFLRRRPNAPGPDLNETDLVKQSTSEATPPPQVQRQRLGPVPSHAA